MTSFATPMMGLPEPQNFISDDFSTHMAIDQTDDLEDNPSYASSPEDEAESNMDPPDEEDKHRAVGNLLAALSSHPNNTNIDAAQQDSNHPQDFQLPTTQTDKSDLEVDIQAIVANTPLPTMDAAMVSGLLSSDGNYVYPDGLLDLASIPLDTDASQFAQMPQESIALEEPEAVAPPPMRREYEAFARLVFPDGNFYLNTYSCELGRDVLAYRAAIERQAEEIKAAEAGIVGEPRPRSAGARSRNPSERLRRQLGSQVQGSIISEAGGFAGIDEEAANQQDPGKQHPNGEPLHSSNDSNSSGLVKPHEVHINPTLLPYDYKRSTDIQAQFNTSRGEIPQDDEKPAPLTSEHLPNPHFCPLIPIHATMQTDKSELEGHRAISRRHVKIYWSFDRDRWEMRTLGRNGAFVNDNFVAPDTFTELEDGATIQISNVQLTFRLPVLTKEKSATPDDVISVDNSAETAMDEVLPSIERRASEISFTETRRASIAESQPVNKINLKFKPPTPATTQPPQQSIGPDGQLPQKKRGPGRPPKDGIMSTRERKELEKAKKMAEAKAANGGKTPPPSGARAKINPKLTPTAMEEVDQGDKPEKRKYKKRKRDANGELIPGEEGEESGEDSDEERKAKKARTQREKSESPAYPAKETLTEEQLQRPTDSYAVLLYKLLDKCYPEALPLKQIYRRLKMEFPYFVHGTGTDGWQSSVRHNLNSEVDKLFSKGDKEGKGFAWRAIPGQTPSQQDKKKTVSQQSIPSKAKMTPPKPFHWQQSGNNFNQPWAGPGANGNWPPNGVPGQMGYPPMAGPPGLQPLPGQVPGASIQPNQPHGMAGQPPKPDANIAAQVQQLREANGFNETSSNSTSGAATMPCTANGLMAVQRFREELLKMIGDDEAQRHNWEIVFNSARRRVLHGYPESDNPEIGDTSQERQIMGHLQRFVKKFPNPNFKYSTYEKQCMDRGEPIKKPTFTPGEDETKKVEEAPPKAAQPDTVTAEPATTS